MSRTWIQALLLGLALAAPGHASALVVSLEPGAGESEMGASIFVETPFLCCAFTQTVTSIPAAGQVSIPPEISPPFEATLDYDLSSLAFEFDYLTTRLDAEDDSAATEGTVFFWVDEDVDYALEGDFSMSDPSGHLALFDVALVDLTTATTLYATAHNSAGAVDAAFDLGIDGFEVILEGSTTGTLLAGHVYRFSFSPQTVVFGGPPENGTVGTGTGSLSLVFVPEPHPAALVAAALAGLAAVAPRSGRRGGERPTAGP